jgi:hypothetical protein
VFRRLPAVANAPRCAQSSGLTDRGPLTVRVATLKTAGFSEIHLAAHFHNEVRRQAVILRRLRSVSREKCEQFLAP